MGSCSASFLSVCEVCRTERAREGARGRVGRRRRHRRIRVHRKKRRSASFGLGRDRSIGRALRLGRSTRARNARRNRQGTTLLESKGRYARFDSVSIPRHDKGERRHRRPRVARDPSTKQGSGVITRFEEIPQVQGCKRTARSMSPRSAMCGRWRAGRL